jgi:hypothetical protein
MAKRNLESDLGRNGGLTVLALIERLCEWGAGIARAPMLDVRPSMNVVTGNRSDATIAGSSGTTARCPLRFNPYAEKTITLDSHVSRINFAGVGRDEDGALIYPGY